MLDDRLTLGQQALSMLAGVNVGLEHPRLGAVAIGSMNGNDFASMLERAIARSGNAQAVAAIEAEYEVVESEPPRLEPPRAPGQGIGASSIKRRSIP